VSAAREEHHAYILEVTAGEQAGRFFVGAVGSTMYHTVKSWSRAGRYSKEAANTLIDSYRPVVRMQPRRIRTVVTLEE